MLFHKLAAKDFQRAPRRGAWVSRQVARRRGFFGRAVVQRSAAASARHGLVDEPHLARHVASFLATAPRRISAREVVAAAHAREALASALAAHDSEEEAG